MPTIELAACLNLTAGERDQLLRPTLERLAGAGPVHRIRQGRTCCGSHTQLLSDTLNALHANGDSPTGGIPVFSGTSAGNLDAALTALAWCGLDSAGSLAAPATARIVAVNKRSKPFRGIRITDQILTELNRQKTSETRH